MGHDDRTGFFFWGMVHDSESVDPLRRIGDATDQHRFYRAWVTIKPVGSAESCRPKANSATKMLLRLTVQRNEPGWVLSRLSENESRRASYLKGYNDHPVLLSMRFLAL
ncbi:hypothetical protein PIB30_029931 [Stylosanthes scabra]|uniref:Uncharacterized protein n=1 Tax=Stylosanthes scabra TaxID=79078 RepID=A0ABU6UAW2_9FABA|nr:hypothetical protein [Stylosanthes scabra]